MPNIIFTADVDSELMAQTTAVLVKDDATLTEVFHQMVNYIVIEGRAPAFQCIEPNSETLAAIAEAENGDLITVGSIAGLMADLNADD